MRFLLTILNNQFPEMVGLQTPMDYVHKIIVPLIATFLFSAFIGLERQNVGKAAGVSPHVLVGLSSAGLAIMQRLMLLYEVSLGTGAFQGQRIIAQVITGIGFIGAGVIMKDHFTVKGLTTAATIWTTAIVGIIFGSGYLIVGSILAVTASLFILARDLKRGINPFKPQKDSHQLKRFRFVKKTEREDLIEEETVE